MSQLEVAKKNEQDDSSCSSSSSSSSEHYINNIPPEVFRYILSHLPHYNDLLVCKLVCKYWYDCVISTLETRARKFKTCLRSSNIEWYHYYPLDTPHISARYSHSCCLHSNLMYIFGGCNSGKTTFNDMWTFDLSQRQWIRPVSSGNYPPPKACCSLVSYKDKLILFGGWTHSSSNRIHDSWKLFNHIHEFDTKTSRWSLIEVMSDCPPMAGHKACIYGNEMIVFGGLQSLENAPYNYLASNDIFAFNISGHTWRKVNIDGQKPPPRYGHSQLVIDDHLVVLGGSSGPKKFLSDFWVLDMRTEPWTWHPIEVIYSQSIEPPIIGTNPVCKVDDLLVCLGRNNNTKSPPSLNDVNFFKKILDRHRCKPCGSNNRPRYRLQPQPSQLERRKLMSSGRYTTMDNETSNNINNKQTILNTHSIESNSKSSQSNNGVKPIKLTTQKSHFSPNSHDALFLYTLDVSQIITEKKVTWLPQENYVPGPQQLLLYSLVVGDSEIIMFGGVRLENGLSNNSSVSNSIYIVTAQKTII